jgi:hypothetical protein
MNNLLKSLRYILFLLLIVINYGYAQEYNTKIHGYVFDGTTGEPIEDVNVYIANSTWGSSTNRDGYYSFSQIIPGAHELVVTIIGYEYESKRFLLNTDSEQKFNFQLKPVIYETETTLVEGEIPEEWLDDLEFFERYFLGEADFANDCEIKNREVLNFKKPDDSIFEATAVQPLIIQNDALGYTIECVLINFVYNYELNTYTWSIKPKFIDLESEDAEKISEWNENRYEAFKGSVYHFLRSFASQRLPEDGFDISRVLQAGQKIPRGQWRTILLEYDEYIEDGMDPETTILHFEHYLHVVFDNSHVSWIGLNYKEITLDKLGNPHEEKPYVVYGEWSKHGLANLLPKNYFPEN